MVDKLIESVRVLGFMLLAAVAMFITIIVYAGPFLVAITLCGIYSTGWWLLLLLIYAPWYVFVIVPVTDWAEEKGYF